MVSTPSLTLSSSHLDLHIAYKTFYNNIGQSALVPRGYLKVALKILALKKYSVSKGLLSLSLCPF